jgi:hypothetical protein
MDKGELQPISPSRSTKKEIPQSDAVVEAPALAQPEAHNP